MPLPPPPVSDFVYQPSNLPTFWVWVSLLDLLAAYWAWLESYETLPLFYYTQISIGGVSLALWGATFFKGCPYDTIWSWYVYFHIALEMFTIYLILVDSKDPLISVSEYFTSEFTLSGLGVRTYF